MRYTACRFKDGKRFDSETDKEYFKHIPTDNAPCIASDEDGNRIFIDMYSDIPELVIFGGGHVAVPTAKIGKLIGFSVTVIDDREEFASRERFPDADRIIYTSFDRLSEIEFSEDAYFVIVTRGHLNDEACLLHVLDRRRSYVGMIGSKAKIAYAYNVLREKGITDEQLKEVHAPIGLKIGAKSPEEIAVSICAELIECRKRSVYNREVYEALFENDEHGTLMTIISTKGSSPGKVGAKAFRCDNGKLLGTIGGGAIEFEAVKAAEHIKGCEVRRFVLNNTDVGSLGMTCGGEAEILFERI